ncbi:MAG: hypothetical protein M3Q42_14035 [Pseudomonadota bacterium]|nr:hypothetical protein [Pseudomonadota bacterium]
MKPNLLTHTLGAMLLCLGLGACSQQAEGPETAQTPYVEPEATTTPEQQPMDSTVQSDPYVTPADPYATTPPIDQNDALTGNTDFSGNQQTTGDTLGDRCAGLAGPTLTECLETERLRSQDVQDPTQTETEDLPRQ